MGTGLRQQGEKHGNTKTTGGRKVSGVLKHQGRRTVTEGDKRNGERSTATGENNSNGERNEERTGNDCRNRYVMKERERKEQKSPPFWPKCWRPGKKHGSGERMRKQVGRQVG